MRNLCHVIFLSAFCLNGILGFWFGKPTSASLSSFRSLPWVPVDLSVHYAQPESSARFAAREILGIGASVPFNVIVTSAWGYAWIAIEGRYGMYYVHFRLRYKNFPFTRYQCSAWVHWPPPPPVHLDGSPLTDFNFCVPF